jgi:simple sugar transport system permease protein
MTVPERPPSVWRTWLNRGFILLAVLMGILFTSIVVLAAGAPPLRAFFEIISGSFGSLRTLANVMVAWSPLLLTTAGLLITFSAGLWNIGIEGQVILGGIFTAGALRIMQAAGTPPALAIGLAIAAGALGGALWGGLAGALKTYGGVNEIFGGLGLNFVATALALWLVFGPWRRPGIASMSGTEPFDEALWLPQLAGSRVSPWSLLLGLASMLLVYRLLEGTYYGLRLKAVGKNARAAFLSGIPTGEYMMSAFLLCGVFAGLTGAIQVTAVYHRLIPGISSGYGFLGLMVAMLVNYQALIAIPVSLFFAAINIGSVQLPLVLKLDSTLAGVLQGALVLFFLMSEGVRKRWLEGPVRTTGDE